MIHYTNSRYNGAPTPHVVTREMTVGNAYRNLVQFELGFGGNVEKLSDEGGIIHICVRTPVLGNYDIVDFIGSAGEMQPLVLATSAFLQLRGELPSDVKMTMLEPIKLKDGGYRPFDLAHFGGILTNYGPAKLVAFAGVGIEPTEELALRSIDDVMSVLEMGLDDNDLATALELLNA